MPSILHILTENRGLDTFPSVYNALFLWKKAGWSNDIATPGDCSDFRQYIDGIYPLKPVNRFLPGAIPGAYSLARINKHYDLIITYEPRDLEALHLARLLSSKKIGSVHLHHSLEIPTYAFAGGGILRPLHRYVMQKAVPDIDLLAIQDMSRYKILCSLFPELLAKQFTIVPNSFLDEVEPVAESLGWFDGIRRTAGTLVLYIGGIERWTLSDEFMDEIAALPDYTFLFSGWSRDGYYEEISARFARYGHIVFDVGIKSRAELNYMVSQADICLAVYDSKDANVTNMGLSSGKFFKCIQHQKPVIINSIPMLDQLVTRNNIGRVYAKGNLGQCIFDLSQGEEYPHSLRNKFAYETFYSKTMKQVIEALKVLT